MSEIIKPDYTYLWSSGGAVVAPSNVKIQTGWTAEVPPFQWENWSQNRQDQAISYLFQKGVSVWSATGEYYFTTSGERSYVQGSDGNIYVATADSIGQDPVSDTTDTYWKVAFIDSTSLALSAPVVGSNRNIKCSITTASSSASVTADEIVVGNTLSTSRYKLTSFSKTINLATTGAGGMDTGAAPVTGYVALYAIYNPTTAVSALLAVNLVFTGTASEIYGGANMPAGYTASALVAILPVATSQFSVSVMIDRKVHTQYRAVVTGSVAPVSLTLVNIASAIPANAKNIDVLAAMLSSGQPAVLTLQTSPMASSVGSVLYAATNSVNSNGSSSYGVSAIFTPQTIYYQASCSSGVPTFNIGVIAYEF